MPVRQVRLDRPSHGLPDWRGVERAVLVGEDGRELPAADAVVVLTGVRPDLSFLSEMRIDLDPTLEAPRRIAAEIDPNIHSCVSSRFLFPLS